jgi:hypothetical protein
MTQPLPNQVYEQSLFFEQKHEKWSSYLPSTEQINVKLDVSFNVSQHFRPVLLYRIQTEKHRALYTRRLSN